MIGLLSNRPNPDPPRPRVYPPLVPRATKLLAGEGVGGPSSNDGTDTSTIYVPEMGKHPDLLVAHPTSTIFTTIGRNYEISFFFAKNFEKVYSKTSTKRPTFGRNLPKVVNFGEKKHLDHDLFRCRNVEM